MPPLLGLGNSRIFCVPVAHSGLETASYDGFKLTIYPPAQAGEVFHGLAYQDGLKPIQGEVRTVGAFQGTEISQDTAMELGFQMPIIPKAATVTEIKATGLQRHMWNSRDGRRHTVFGPLAEFLSMWGQLGQEPDSWLWLFRFCDK